MMGNKINNINNIYIKYCNRKMLVILLLGISSGLPIALIGGTLQAWFKYSGIDIVTIGLLTLVGQPYSYKYLWAPLLDKFALPYLGKRRGWVITFQLIIVMLTAIVAFLSPAHQPWLIAAIALLLAFVSASQDIVVDAYRVEILAANERGIGAALGVEGYRLGTIIAGGFALILADNIGWQKTYLLIALVMALGMLVVFIAPEPSAGHSDVENVELDDVPGTKYASKLVSIFQLVKAAFVEFFQRRQAVSLLALIIFYKLGDAFSHALSTVFLLDIGFSLTTVGTLNKIIGLCAVLLGIFYGGILMIRISLFNALLIFGVLQAATNLLYMFIALLGKNYMVAATVIFIENMCAGMGTAAFVALLMSLCNPKFTATQYALLSSLMAMGRVYVGPISGVMVDSFGWVAFYFCTGLFAIPGLVLLLWLRKTIIYESLPWEQKIEHVANSVIGERDIADNRQPA